MATDARGHTVPSGSEAPKRQAILDLSDTICDVRLVGSQDEATAAVADMQAANLEVTGTAWWFASPGALYVYDGAAFNQLAFQAPIDKRMPYASTAGYVSISSVKADTEKSMTVTFPAGLFTAPPRVTTTPQSGSPRIRSSSVNAITKSSAMIWVGNSGSSTGDLGVHWIAAQPSSADVALMAADEPHTDATVTCPTSGCRNEGIPLGIVGHWTDEDGVVQSVDAVECGVCGTDITDTLKTEGGS